MEKLRIVVSGFIGWLPSGGITWDYLQYPLGFKLLGHDVYYIEDTGYYSTYQIGDVPNPSPLDSVSYLEETMRTYGLAERWAYRDTFNGECYGMSLARVLEVCATADVFVNVSAANISRDEYLRIPARVLLDSDPMFTQVDLTKTRPVDLQYHTSIIPLTEYTHYFSFGENIGAQDCRVPTLQLKWVPTRQPICSGYWAAAGRETQPAKLNYTTVMNWSARSKLIFENEEWGQKDVEFKKFIGVPQLFKEVDFKIILNASEAFKKDINPAYIEAFGWQILDPVSTIGTPQAYKDFLQRSAAEFSVAKETYVKSNSGWFSGRSACYLAAGRPVIAQETQWSKYVPTGEGLFAYSDLETAGAAVAEVAQNYSRHARAAKALAHEYFDSGKVLSHLLAQLD